jgi:archaemetzincin
MPKDEQRMLIQFRACKTMSHEISHMFGVRHCIYFECIMNGSNKIAEADKKPPRKIFDI